MKNKIFKILLLTIILAIVASRTDLVKNIIARISTAEASGGLTIDWGVPTGQPIFVVAGMLPGDKEERTVKVTNDSTETMPLTIKGILVSETGNLSSKLSLTIKDNGNLIYGPKNLNEFLAQTNISLGNINPNTSHNFLFTVVFDPQAGNEFQNTQVVFDLQMATSQNIPAQCGVMRFDNIIYGTDKNDNLRGGNKNDLIFGLSGNDKLNGSNSNDCLVGGDGDDILDGSNGKDFLLGGNGNDILDGSNGEDIAYGGPGDDLFRGTNGKDVMYGDEGNDRFYTSNGNDYVEGGDGDDHMEGGNGNDTLLGQAGSDKADGGLGTDTCEAETKVKCEK